MNLKYPALLAAFCASAVQANDLVITEIMQNPSAVSDSAGEWFEVLNTGDADINLNGWTISDNDNDSFVIEQDVSVQAGHYAVLSNNSDMATNGGVTVVYQYSGMFLSNGGDELVITSSSLAEIDRVEWDGGATFPDPTGASMVLVDITLDNNVGANWATSTEVYGNGDLGTPNSGPDGEPSDGGGGDGGGDDPTTGGCVNCDPVTKVADATTFNAEQYYALVNDQINALPDTPVEDDYVSVKQVLSETITSDTVLSYSQVWSALTYTDEDPADPDNIILWYTGTPRGKNLNGGDAGTDWNREHSWPSSHGFGDSNGGFEAFTDIHHLRASDVSVNSVRGNLDFDDSDAEVAIAAGNFVDGDSFEPRDEIKGDVARMMFYMDTRYEGLADVTPDLMLVDNLTSSGTEMLGRLCRLWEWHLEDAVDGAEILRNDTIYEYQGNRNPFIDNPDWAAFFYTTDACSDNGDGDGEGEGGGPTGSSDIVISGVIDGPLSGGVPKAIELFVVNDIEDLSVCGIGSANNGGGSDGQEFTFDPISASAGDFIYVASEAVGFNSFFGFDPDYTSGAASINGDDAIELFCADEVVDTFGDINVDGNGEPWEYLDGWAYRKANTGPDSSVFVLDNWTFSGANALDGVSDNASAEQPFPIGTFFVDEKLIISGVVDASLTGGTPKMVEFYAATDIEDLSVFGFGSANNGNGSDGQEYTFTGSASKGDYIYIASESTNFEVFFGFAPTDTSGAASINGDDAIELFKDGVVVDTFGDINVDGNGEPWEYLDGWAYRVSNTGPDGATFTLENWTFSGINVFDGQLTNDSAITPFPLASFAGGGDGGGGGGGEEPGGCCDETTLIHAVQGSGDASPLMGETVLIEGIVSASFAGQSGFFVQEESADMDADPQTSEGVFVSYSGELPVVGSLVSVIGDVSESFGRTQLTATQAPEIITLDTEGAQVFSLTLPFVDAAEAESLEGMLVATSQALVVTDNFTLGRFGQVTLSTERLFTPTNVFDPGSDEANDLAAANALNRILLDDGDNTQNPELVVFPTGGLSASNTLRLGDTVAALTGVVDFSFGDYRVIPTQDPTFVATNPRTAEPDLGLGNVKVASLNVLNYFNNIDTGPNICGPSANSGCRGADSDLEFERQKAKTVAAIVAMDADIVGLMEIENNGFSAGSAINDLVAQINAIMGAGTYSIVDPGAPIGTDAITVAFIYKSSVVSLTGAAQILDSSNSISDEDGVLFVDTRNRPSLVQEFALLENGETLVISVNHLKSKGSGCGAGDDDTTTGQGNCNLTRTRAAQALSAFLDTQYPDTATLIIGDLNAYAKEDPISALEDAGYTNLVNYFGGEETYSYSFRGLLGYLDHALANNKALAKVVDVTEWHINADEPIAFDYNVENKTDDNVTDYYADDAYRMSDHDPVLIALQLDAAVVSAASADVNQDGSIDFSDYFAILTMLGSVTGDANFDAIADYDEDGVISPLDLQAWYQLFLSQ